MKDLWDNFCTGFKQVVAGVQKEIVINPPITIDVDDDRLQFVGDVARAMMPEASQAVVSDIARGRPIKFNISWDTAAFSSKTADAPPTEDKFVLTPAPVFFEGPDVYRMSGMPRGQCIIFNNKDFEETRKSRSGSEMDVARMEELFTALHFDVHIRCNLTAAEMKETLSIAAEDQCESSDCLVVIIMSHGARGKIEGVDGDQLDLGDDVYSLFNNRNCPALQKKPKIFFVQACRGGEHDNGVPATGGGDGADSGRPETKKPNKRLAAWSDMYTAYATIPGHVAHRHLKEGSWFISAVYEVFRSMARTMHLQDMMLRVAERVTERCGHDGSRQTPINEYGWTKKLYFNVGHFRELN